MEAEILLSYQLPGNDCFFSRGRCGFSGWVWVQEPAESDVGKSSLLRRHEANWLKFLLCWGLLVQRKCGTAQNKPLRPYFGQQWHGSHVSQMGTLDATNPALRQAMWLSFHVTSWLLGSLHIPAKHTLCVCMGCQEGWWGSLLATHSPPKNTARANMGKSEKINLKPQLQKRNLKKRSSRITHFSQTGKKLWLAKNMYKHHKLCVNLLHASGVKNSHAFRSPANNVSVWNRMEYIRKQEWSGFPANPILKQIHK